MDLSASVLGRGIAAALSDREKAAVLIIGRDRFTRVDLATVKCFNYQAAAALSAALATFGVKSTAHLFDTVSPSALALPRIGAIALAVLGAAFQARGVGGAAPLEAWVAKHDDDHHSVVTFTTIKHRAEVARQLTKRKRA